MKFLGDSEHSLDDPVLHYLNSWLYDDSQRELTRKPTWRNFIQVLKEIDLGELAKEMEDFLAKTTPLEDEQANQSGILLTIICLPPTCNVRIQGQLYNIILLLVLPAIYFNVTETVTDEIANLQCQLNSLKKEVSEMQESIVQPIKPKLDACCSLCFNAFRHLGEEKKGYMDTIKSLQDENQKLKESTQQQGTIYSPLHI